ncbi:MAG: phosphoribosylglycinamide formyltransferase [Gammaproteobacteria bacterium]
MDAKYTARARLNIVVLASGNGSNLQAIMDAIDSGKCPARICAVISDNPNALALKRAQVAHIPTFALEPHPKEPSAVFNERLTNLLRALDFELIVLAGYMRILSPAFVHAFDGRIINIHPALLPKYKGLNTHARALAAKDKEHGATVHFVSEGVDEGAIIAQVVVPIKPHDTVERLRKRVIAQEHRLYPQVIAWFAAKKVQLKNGRVYIGDVLCEDRGMLVRF